MMRQSKNSQVFLDNDMLDKKCGYAVGIFWMTGWFVFLLRIFITLHQLDAELRVI